VRRSSGSTRKICWWGSVFQHGVPAGGGSALAGHRDTHLAALRDIRVGDRIRVETPDGVFFYAVDSSFVVSPERGDLLRPTGRAMLTLVTCYPFHWIGPAPKRFIVRAHRVRAREAVKGDAAAAAPAPGGQTAAR
jgi:sortase A